MQERQLKTLRGNIVGIWKMLESKREKKIKGYLQGKNYLGDIQQESCLDGQTKGMTRNIGEDWKGTREDRKKNKLEKEKQQKQSRKRKKLSRKSQEPENRQKTIKWEIYRTHMMSYKSLG